MSDTATETQGTTEAQDALSEQISDNSRAADPAAVAVAKTALVKVAKSLVTSFGRFRGLAKSYAREDLSIRSMMTGPKGVPPWNATKDPQVYAVLVGDPLRDALSDSPRDVQSAIRANVRKAVERERPEFVVRWIARHEGSKLSSEEVAAILGSGDETADAASLAKVMGDPSNALKKRVREHYGMCELTTVPAEFAESRETAPPAPGPDSPPSEVLQSMNAGAAAVESGAIATSAAGDVLTVLHRQATALAGNLFDNAGKLGEIDNRPAAIHSAQRTAELLAIVAKLLDGKSTPEDLEHGRTLFFATAK